uniref:Vacuolar fusion protein MON1 homolog n=1 Tax=Ditylenchus dipsaci TaxID=166011 RepID=A0A915E7S4_9BILA
MDDALSYSENASSSSDLAVSNKNLFKDTQIWILSEFGKPIFSSCGRECELSSTFALIQALVMRYESWKDSLLSIQMTNLYIQFSYRSPLIVCIVSHQPSLYHDKIHIESFFEKMGENYDMRRWLKDIDQRVNACAKGFNEDPVVFLSGFRILPLHPPDRDYIVSTLGTIINQYSPNNVVFGMLVAHRQLVALVRMKKLNLTPSDFNTIVSMIECHESQLKEGGSWVPTCLPVFDSNSYLHAYISFLWDGAGPCLILLSVSPTVETFGELSTVRVKFEENILVTHLNNLCV